MGFGLFFKDRKKNAEADLRRTSDSICRQPVETRISNKKVADIIAKIGYRIIEEREFLTELDMRIGDGDHGINLSRGFQKVIPRLPALEDKDIGTILKTTGMILVSTVGGESGPLYGTLFMKMGAHLSGKMEITFDEFTAALEQGIKGVKQRGKSTTGEKTMLDAMVPACYVMQQSWDTEHDAVLALREGVKAAEAGCEATKELVATKGRASYLGERSLGYMDPGAVSFSIMLGVVKKEVSS